MLTAEKVEQVLKEIVGQDERTIDVQFPSVSITTSHPERYEHVTDKILTSLIELSGTSGPMTFGYCVEGEAGPPDAGDRAPLPPTRPLPNTASEAASH